MERSEGPVKYHHAVPVQLQRDGLKIMELCSTRHWCHLGVTAYHQLTEVLQAGQQPIKVHFRGHQ